MKKTKTSKTIYVCSECGTESDRIYGDNMAWNNVKQKWENEPEKGFCIPCNDIMYMLKKKIK